MEWLELERDSVQKYLNTIHLIVQTTLREKMNGLPYLSMKPYYRGFKGKVVKVDEKGISKFITKGKYSIEDDKVTITELLSVIGHMILRNF